VRVLELVEQKIRPATHLLQKQEAELASLQQVPMSDDEYVKGEPLAFHPDTNELIYEDNLALVMHEKMAYHLKLKSEDFTIKLAESNFMDQQFVQWYVQTIKGE
jgi:hypothetical protein